MSDQTNESLFQNQEVTPPVTPPTQESPYATLLGQIKNEKGEQKYKSLEDALVGLKNAQEFIPQLKDRTKEYEAELADLRTKAAKVDSIEAALLELTKRQEERSTNGVALNENDIQSLVEKTLTKKQQADVQRANQSSVVTTFQEKFGDKAEEVFYSKAKELGMTPEEVNALSAKSPKAALTMLGVGTGAYQQPKVSPTTSSIKTDGFQGGGNQTFVRRNENMVSIGATSDDVQKSKQFANNMVDELHKQGKHVADLSDPKEYKKYFG